MCLSFVNVCLSLSLCLYVCLSISLCLSVCLSVCLFVYLCQWQDVGCGVQIMSLRREQQQGEQRLQQGWEELHREREELQRQRDELRGEWEKLEREKERVGEGRSKPVGAPRTGENLLSVAAVASHHTGEELSDASSVVESDDGSMNDIVAPLSSSEGSGAGARAQHVRVFHFAQGIPSPGLSCPPGPLSLTHSLTHSSNTHGHI